MDKIQYSRLVRGRASQVFARLFPLAAGSHGEVYIRNIAEQYVSITEADGLARFTLFPDILQRAIAACANEEQPDAGFEVNLARVFGAQAEKLARSQTRTVLELTFQELHDAQLPGSWPCVMRGQLSFSAARYSKRPGQ